MRTIWTLLLVTVLAGTAFAAPEAKKESKGGDKAKALFEAKCSTCHPLSRPLSATKDKADWALTIKRMRQTNGCQLTDKEANDIAEYLAKIRGPKK